MTTIAESAIEKAALVWLAKLGYTVLHGRDIAPDTSDAEALPRLNSKIQPTKKPPS